MRITNQKIAVAAAALVSLTLITLGVLGILRKISMYNKVANGLVAGGGGLAGLTVLAIAIKHFCNRPPQGKVLYPSGDKPSLGTSDQVAEKYQDALQRYHGAVESDREKIRNELIELIEKGGQDPLTFSTKRDLGHAEDSLGYTVLHLAAMHGDLELINHLKLHHRDRYNAMLKDRCGGGKQTPLDSAKGNLATAQSTITTYTKQHYVNNAAKLVADGKQAVQRYTTVIKALS